MRIVFVGSEHQLGLHKLGGIENVVRQLIFYLKDRQCHISLLKVGYRPFDIEFLAVERNLVTFVGNKAQVRGEILALPFDVVVFLETLFQSPLFLLKYLKKKQVEKFRSIKMFFTYPPFKTNLLFQRIKMALCIDESIVFSNRLAQSLAENWHGTIHGLLPPVDDYYFQINRERGIKTRVGYVGRLSRDKGVLLLPRIFEGLDPEQFEFFIFGYFSRAEDKRLFRSYMKDVTTPIQTRIIATSEQVKRPWAPLDRLDYLLLPYQTLSDKTLDIPLLILEGLVAGCRVFTSNIGSLSGIHPNVTTVDNYQSPSAFTDAIQSSYKLPLAEVEYKPLCIDTIGEQFFDIVKGPNGGFRWMNSLGKL